MPTDFFVLNILLIRFLGAETLDELAQSWKKALVIGGLMVLILPAVTFLNVFLNEKFLVPYSLEYLRVAVFFAGICLISGLVSLCLKAMAQQFSNEYSFLISTWPLNSLFLGTSLWVTYFEVTLNQAFIWSVFTALGWWFVLIVVTAIRQKLKLATSPNPYQTVGLLLILLGIFSFLTAALNGIGERFGF